MVDNFETYPLVNSIQKLNGKVPSGQRFHNENHSLAMGKSTNSMTMFNSKLLVYKRVSQL